MLWDVFNWIPAKKLICQHCTIVQRHPKGLVSYIRSLAISRDEDGGGDDGLWFVVVVLDSLVLCGNECDGDDQNLPHHYCCYLCCYHYHYRHYIVTSVYSFYYFCHFCIIAVVVVAVVVVVVVIVLLLVFVVVGMMDDYDTDAWAMMSMNGDWWGWSTHGDE